MSASHECIEWHLTPRGWERGTFHHDGGVKEKDPPTDRVQTMIFDELWPSGFSKRPKTELKEIWRSDDTEAVERLIKQHGLCPKSL